VRLLLSYINKLSLYFVQSNSSCQIQSQTDLMQVIKQTSPNQIQLFIRT